MAAIRGDYLLLHVQQHSSGVADAYIADSTSINIDMSAEALETTSQDDGLNATFIGGKVSGTISGDYLLASDGDQFTNLFAHMNAADVLSVDVYLNGSSYFTCDGVLTSLSLTGGLSDSLSTGAYTLQLSGALTFP